MKKIILAALFLFFGSATTTHAFDGAFLDEIQVNVFHNGKISARDAEKVLLLSSEAPKNAILLEEQNADESETVSSEDPAEQAINDPVLSKTRRDFSFLKAPKVESVEALFEISDRKFSTSRSIVRERQRRAREKALRYRTMFRDRK